MDDIEPQALARLENALAAAARRFVSESRAAIETMESRAFLEAVCRRLGFASSVAATIADGSADAAVRASVAERLGAEKASLQRLGRRADPRYDVNRHIAIHHALKMLGDRERVASPSRPPSGNELNRRFANGKRARRPSTSRPSASLRFRTATEAAAR